MINNIISNIAVPSAKLLRDAFIALGYPKLLVTRDTNKRIILRYGYSGQCLIKKDIFNCPDFIKLTVDKRNFSTLCYDLGLCSPVFVRLKEKLPEHFPILVRETLTGYGSNGIIPITTIDELEGLSPHLYWTPYYKLSTEYRVHIVNKKIIRIFVKNFDGEVRDDGVIIRNNTNSHFSLIDLERKIANGRFKKLFSIVEILTESLMEKYGNIFFALDVGWGSNEKDYIILEGNSAPGLNENSAYSYAQEIGPILFENELS